MDLSYHWRIFFISTHALTEGDAQNIYDSISAGHFNSRPHGGRQRTRADDNTGGVFQLTPSRRATSLYFWIASSSGLFQLTPSRRATTLMTFSEKSISFQLTPSRRATLVPYNDFEEKVFQLTPSRRATINPAITLATTLFQLTPSRRATTLRKSGAWNCEDFNSRPHGGRRHCTSG